MLRRHFALSAGFLIICCAVSALAQTQTGANAIVPQLVKFSGILTDDSGQPLIGTVGVTFLLYKDEQGGSPLWLETQNVHPSKGGSYTVMLGSTTSQGLPPDIFVSGEARWLAVQAQGQQEYPRVLLVSVPYALKAVDAQTIGGLPPSAFVLAAPPIGAASVSATEPATGQGAPPPSGTVTGTGTVNFIPLWDTTSDIISSVLFQSGTGSTAKVGIGTTAPATPLDVKGSGTIRGLLSLPTTGTATASAGKISQPLSLAASAFNSSTVKAVTQTFQWQAEPAANDTSNPSGTLNLLFASGTSKPTETGFNIASNGLIKFATGQTFPGTGDGTITGVTAGTDLTGGGTSGTVTLNLDTTKVPQLATANTFTGNQTVNGNLTATGPVTGGSYQIGSNLFAFGSSSAGNAFLGFAGNTTTTGEGGNTAVGYAALSSVTTGNSNTALGGNALFKNTGDNSGNGSANTASGALALEENTTGNYNTASGYLSGHTADAEAMIGSNDTAIGSASAFSTGTLNNATVIGANAEVAESNALVLGSINGVNFATASTNVGIGTTAPTYLLHIGNSGGATYNNFLRVEGPTQQNTNTWATSFGGYGAFGIDSVGYPGGRFYVLENGNVGIGCRQYFCGTGIFAIGQGLGSAVADGWITYSSRRWKKNIHTLHGALAKVQQLRGVSYDRKDGGKHEVGVIAEEVGAVVPEVVSYEENGKDARGVDYSRLTALLIEATKEQQREIQREQAELAKALRQISQQQNLLRAQSSAVRSLQAEVREARRVARLQ